MKIYLGAGGSPRDGWINIDNRALTGIDIVRDVLRGLPFADGTIEEIASDNFLEHIPQEEVIWFMNEMWRVLQDNGRSHHRIALAGTANFYQDPTHLSHWIPMGLEYFTKDHYKNLYYNGDIKPWVIEKCDIISNGHGMETVMIKSC